LHSLIKLGNLTFLTSDQPSGPILHLEAIIDCKIKMIQVDQYQ